MKSKIALTIACLTVPVLACANEERAQGDLSVIARVGAKEIHYRDIRCAARFQAPPDDTRCHTVEQQKLDALVTAELVAEAARIHGIMVSDEEVLASAPKGAVLSDEQVEHLAERFRTMAAAVLKVRDGAPADEVFARDVAPNGISRGEFDSAYARWSREDAQKALTLDYAAQTKRQLVMNYRTALLLRRMRELAASRAAERHVTPEEVSLELWRGVVAKSGAKVLDTRYSFPDLERL